MDQFLADLPGRLEAVAWAAAGFAAAVAIFFVVYRVLAAFAGQVVARAEAAPMLGESDLEADERAVRRAERHRRLQTLSAFVLRLVRWGAYVTIVIMAIATFAPGIWDRLGGLGVGFGAAVGAALGFGAQQLVRDYLNGALILGENPYSVGDVVSIAGVRGTVEDVNLRRTVIRDMDGTLHSVPNGEVQVASNFTRGFARVNERIVVAYGTDIGRATVIINDVGEALTADPAWSSRLVAAPRVLRVEPVADPGIPILVSATVRPGAQWEVAGELRARIIEAFAAAGVELATGRKLVLAQRGGSGQAGAAVPLPEDTPGATGDAEFT